MPPGPTYNAICVVSALANVLSHAARIRAAQLATRRGTTGTVTKRTKYAPDIIPEDAIRRHEAQHGDLHEPSKASSDAHKPAYTPSVDFTISPGSSAYSATYGGTEEEVVKLNHKITEDAVNPLRPEISGYADDPVKRRECVLPEERTVPSSVAIKQSEASVSAYAAEEVSLLLPPSSGEQDARPDVEPANTREEPVVTPPVEPLTPTRTLRASRVPSSRIGRLFHYGGLAASLGYGAASELLQRSTGMSSQTSSPVLMTEANIHRLVSKLLKMRGAALKLGQFMSIQDTHVLPPEVDRIFRMVQDSAHYMPDWQMEKVLSGSLGPNWASYFSSFDRIPFAAASIGQVHRAVLSESYSPTGRAEDVAVKIQFPNIADSIESDLGYIKILLTAGALLPKGLFLDRTIQVMKDELTDECNYTREASFLRKFGSSDFLGNDKRFKVPWVWEGSTKDVLVMERVEGVSIGAITHGDAAKRLSREDRIDIASSILQLCLRELFDFRVMQTDPNWTNFLWNPRTRQIELVDFGATREYSKQFMDDWLHLLQAAISEDRNRCIEWSIKLGYLTGEENDTMLDAHVASMTLLATPFKPSTTQPFAFGPGSEWADITARIRAQIPVMLKHRLTPPPKETYSLNRKLSGSFLLASRLGARFDTRSLWDHVVGKYQFDY